MPEFVFLKLVKPRSLAGQATVMLEMPANRAEDQRTEGKYENINDQKK